ncbi:MAG: helix-turn-helix domain-containing protein [Rhodospirillales bacterium]|nr:helix-turn-helix domain-containing protein [Rhodospirillales bacterium]MDH3912753.1 helix-turn-helix domain-containing protein [Rhodospirillales bacterium]MDH3968003.1 helix-turn-helix domain-containing protein [Rhodospirillales bacterium]
MDVEPSFAIIGALIGVPARANILSALMDGRAQTATELAFHSGVSAQTASSHLAKLTDAKLLVAERHGRHRYYRLASPAVAEAIEPLTNLVAHRPVPARRKSKALEELRTARMCYDHLAGGLGVALTDALLAQGHLVPAGRDFRVTAEGERFLARVGLDLKAVRAQRRIFARQCLDWSERRPHLGGALGAAFAARCLAGKWIRRAPEGRKVVMTPAGRDAFARLLPGFAD